MKVWAIRLLAALLFVGGIWASNSGRVLRKYSRHLDFTFSSPKPGQIDAIFKKASGRSSTPNADILRKDIAQPDGLKIHVFAHTWQGAQDVQTELANQIRHFAAKEQLAVVESSMGTGAYESSEYHLRQKIAFIASAVAIASGLAVIVLSLRIFGGGKLEPQPQ
jgi:hypothetical protein